MAGRTERRCENPQMAHHQTRSETCTLLCGVIFPQKLFFPLKFLLRIKEYRILKGFHFPLNRENLKDLRKF